MRIMTSFFPLFNFWEMQVSEIEREEGSIKINLARISFCMSTLSEIGRCRVHPVPLLVRRGGPLAIGTGMVDLLVSSAWS